MQGPPKPRHAGFPHPYMHASTTALRISGGPFSLPYGRTMMGVFLVAQK